MTGDINVPGALDESPGVEATSKIFTEMPRRQFVGFLVTIFATTYVLFSAMIPIPIIGHFYELFGDRPAMVNYVVSGGLLIAILANLAGARLMRRISKRSLMIAGIIIFTLASTFQVSVLNIAYIAVMGTISGIGCGLVVIAAPSLLSDAYPDAKRRAAMLGWYNAVGALVGAALSALAGVIAAGATSWTSVYWLYAITAVVLVLTIRYVPTTPTDADKASASSIAAATDRIPLLPMASLGIAGFVLSLVYMVPVYLISVLVSEQSLGDEGTAGLLSSITTIGAAIGCAALGAVARHLGRGVGAIAFALTAISMLLFMADSLTSVAVGSAILGFGYGLGFVHYTAAATNIVPPAKVAVALSIAWAAINLGGFASTYAVTVTKSAFGVTTVLGLFPYMLVLVAVSTALSAGAALYPKHRRRPRVIAESADATAETSVTAPI